MKKFLLSIILLAVLLCPMLVSYCNGDTLIELKSDKVELKCGDEFYISVLINELPTLSEAKIRSFNIDIGYDSNVFEVLEVSRGDIPSRNFLFNNNNKGILLTGDYQLAPYQAGDNFMTLKCVVKSDVAVGTYGFKLTKAALWNEKGPSSKFELITKDIDLKVIDDNTNPDPVKVLNIKGLVHLPISCEVGDGLEIYQGDNKICTLPIAESTDTFELQYGDAKIEDFDTDSKLTIILKLKDGIYKNLMIDISKLIFEGEEGFVKDLTDVIDLGEVTMKSGNVNNEDITVDYNDIKLFESSYMKKDYSDICDITNDHKVNIKDAYYINQSFGY